MDAELLRQYLEFYQDLGIKTLYRQVAPPVETPMDLPPLAPTGDTILRSVSPMSPTILRSVSQVAPPVETPMDLPPLAPTGDTLLKIVEDIGDCHRCRLSAARNKIVFGVGNPQSPRSEEH